MAFLYSNKKLHKKRIFKINKKNFLKIPFIIETKKTKCLINNQRGERSHTENYKTMMKEIKEDTGKMEKHPMFVDWKN